MEQVERFIHVTKYMVILASVIALPFVFITTDSTATAIDQDKKVTINNCSTSRNCY